MTFAEAVRKCSSIANHEGPMEVDTSEAFVFGNAVITFSMDQGRVLKILVVAGKPTHFEEEIDDLLEKVE